MRLGLRERDLLNPEFGDGLAVAVPGPHSLLRLIAEGHDFGGEALADDARANGGVLHERAADHEVFAVVREHDAVEDHFRSGIAGDAIEAENLAFLNLEMTAIGFDDGVHGVDCDLSDE